MARSVSEYSEIVFQKYNGLCATWNHATTYSTKSDYSDTLLATIALFACRLTKMYDHIKSGRPCGWLRRRLDVKRRARTEEAVRQLIARIVPRLENLASNPRPPGCKKLQGGDREWRIRIGDYAWCT